jgi:hypothetical protein
LCFTGAMLLAASAAVPLSSLQQIRPNAESHQYDTDSATTAQVAARLLSTAEPGKNQGVQVWWNGVRSARDDRIQMRSLRWFVWPDMPRLRDRATVEEDGWVLGIGYRHDELLAALIRAAPDVEWSFVDGHKVYPGDLAFDPFNEEESRAALTFASSVPGWPVVLLKNKVNATSAGLLDEEPLPQQVDGGWVAPEARPGAIAWVAWSGSAILLVMPGLVFLLLHSRHCAQYGVVELMLASALTGSVLTGIAWSVAGQAGWIGFVILAIVSFGILLWHLWTAADSRARWFRSMETRAQLSAFRPAKARLMVIGMAWMLFGAAGFALFAGLWRGPAENVAGLGNWLWKARFVADQQTWPWEPLRMDREGLHMGRYPPGYPLLIAWGQWFAGGMDRWLPQCWTLLGWLLSCIALVLVVSRTGCMKACEATGRHFSSPGWLLAAMALGCAGPWLEAAGGVQADGWVAGATLLGWFWMARWVVTNQSVWLVAGCTLAGIGGGWFKDEGTAFALAGWLACVLARPGALLNGAWWLGGCLVMVLPLVWRIVLAQQEIVGAAVDLRLPAVILWPEWIERIKIVAAEISNRLIAPEFIAWRDRRSYLLWGLLPLISFFIGSGSATQVWRGKAHWRLAMFWAAGSVLAFLSVCMALVLTTFSVMDLDWLASVTLGRTGWVPMAAGLVALAAFSRAFMGKTVPSGQSPVETVILPPRPSNR